MIQKRLGHKSIQITVDVYGGVLFQTHQVADRAVERALGGQQSVKELMTAISRFINGWHQRCHPFTWTKSADEILPHATRQATSDARH